MRIDIRRKSAQRDFNAKMLRERIERRLRFSLGRFGNRISHVCLFLEDLNGPRGGMDLECRAVAKVRRLGDVMVEVRDYRIETLVDRVAERLGRVVTRRLERQRFGRSRMALNGSTDLDGSNDGKSDL